MSEWTPIEKGFPAKEGTYLLTDGKTISISELVLYYFDKEPYDKPEWWGLDDFYSQADFSSSEVTHWMVPPELPKVKDYES